MLLAFIRAFSILFVILDPFGVFPIFLSLTEGFSVTQRRKAANSAIIFAAAILFAFLFAGSLVLDYFSISLGSFKIAGGIILLLVGLEYALDFSLSRSAVRYDIALVPMATPLISGPGALATVLILVKSYGYVPTVLAAMACFEAYWIVLASSSVLYRYIGKQGSHIISRIMGVFLCVISAQYIVDGIRSAFGIT